MLKVITSEVRKAEKLWVLQVVLQEFLGLQYHVVFDNAQKDFAFDHDGKQLIITNTFLNESAEQWLTEQSIPTSIASADVKNCTTEVALVSQQIPLLFDNEFANDVTESGGKLHLDVFGTAFFMLSRYEEVANTARDDRNRFSFFSSIAHKFEFHNRPIVDEYVQILWGTLIRVWPNLSKKTLTASNDISCDVDDPYAKSAKAFSKVVREVGVAAIKYKDLALSAKFFANAFLSKAGHYQYDPYNTFDWIMSQNETAGNSVTFYFICGHDAGAIDGSYRLSEKRIQTLMKDIHKRGHKIGLHGSYNSYNNAEILEKEANRLRQALHTLGISQSELGTRQHYLRWSTPETAVSLNRLGFDFDSSLGFADSPGFRCGTCHEYSMFDVVNSEPLTIRQKPLIAMECSVLSNRYLALGCSPEATALFDYYKSICKRFNGSFGLLWHNSYFLSKKEKALYTHLLSLPG